MSEMKFTPGPWRIAGKGTVRKGDSEWIADVHWRNRDANARLIAAAPELFAALKRWADNPDGWSVDQVNEARAALAKAQPQKE